MNSNSLEFIILTLRNFLSFGNKETTVKLNGNTLTVVMGENLDTGGEDSRNGVGKSAIMDALCYVLFGKVIRSTSNKGLINKWANKRESMMVTLTFDKGNWSYLVERGERPSRLSLFRKPKDSTEDFKIREGRTFKYNISRNKNETTDEIVGILGYDITLAEYLIANSSESIEYFKLTEEKRRDIIEKLFGFSILSEKAKILKEERKEKNKKFTIAETALNATKQANARIQNEVDGLNGRSEMWEQDKAETITELRGVIEALEAVDVENEIELLKLFGDLEKKLAKAKATASQHEVEYSSVEQTLTQNEKSQDREKKELEKATLALKELDDSKCPTCKQHWVADPEYRENKVIQTKTCHITIETLTKEIGVDKPKLVRIGKLVSSATNERNEIENSITEIHDADLTYESVEEAAGAEATLKSLRSQMKNKEDEINPHLESIDKFKANAIQQTDDSEVKELQKLINHYNVLIELLTNKNSYIRKLIIDRWLPKLNARISYWLKVLELPHQVAFQPDLCVEIRLYHEEYDHGNLSKGERNRLRIAMNFAFQDTFEYMNYRINLLGVDELIDNGICPRGAANAVAALQSMCITKDKRVLLVTHRDDIAAQVDDVMLVKKENEMSWIETSNL